MEIDKSNDMYSQNQLTYQLIFATTQKNKIDSRRASD